MHKSLSSIFIFLFAKFSFSQHVTATQKIPNQIQQGSEYIVEVTINKGTNANYLRFSQRLPPSFTASEINSSNGKFSFKDGLVKIAWIVPPPEEEFTISFKVMVPKETTGDKQVKGRVYYYINTRKYFFQLEPNIINIVNENNAIESVATPAIDSAINTQVLNSDTIKQAFSDAIKSRNNTDINASVTIKEAAVSAIDSTLNTQAFYSDTTKQIISDIIKSTNTTNDNTSVIIKKDTIASIPKTYRVQVVALKEKKREDIPEVFSITDDKGITKYFSGNFLTYEEAVIRKKYMIDIGFKDAFIVTFENGKILTK